MDSDIIKKLDNFFLPYQKRQYSKGDIFINTNENPSGVFYLADGIARQYWISSEGSETTLNLYKPHTFFPMSWAIGNVENKHFFQAMTNIVVHIAPREHVIAFLKKETYVMYNLLQRMYIGLDGLWMHMESQSLGKAEIKLLVTLVIMARRFGKKVEGSTIIDLKITESDIASYAGISRETVSRQISDLKKQNLVSFSKETISISDLKKLEELIS